MSFSHSILRILGVASVALALGTLSTATQAQGQSQQPAGQAADASTAQAAPQNNSVCGNLPYCYETDDFVAAIKDFRTSTVSYYHIIDVTLRVLNKTDHQLGFGYNNGSGFAIDDQGVRYAVGGNNPLRGMGFVNGQAFDPKFQVRPGSFGDAQFELVSAGAQVWGLTFELDLTVSAINAAEGNQHTLGGEFPLQFQGLKNGISAATSGLASSGSAIAGNSGGNSGGSSGGAPVCGPTGTATAMANATGSASAQNAANTANSTVSSASDVMKSLGSIFHKKKADSSASNSNAANTTPCVPAASGAASSVSNTVSTIQNGVAQPGTAAPGTTPAMSGTAVATPATPTAPAIQQMGTKLATPGMTGAKTTKPVTTSPAKPATTAPAKPATTTPAPAAKPAATTPPPAAKRPVTKTTPPPAKAQKPPAPVTPPPPGTSKGSGR